MYEECLYVFDSMTCDESIMKTKRTSFNEKHTQLSEKFEAWHQTSISLYRSNQFAPRKFTEKLQDFMNHLLFLYASLSDKGNADIQDRPHFHFDSKTPIYSKFYLMMCESPWRDLHNGTKSTTEWKEHMVWMGKRLFYIAYYNNEADNWQAYTNVRDFIHHFKVQEARSDEDLWNDGVPNWFISSRKKPGNMKLDDSSLHSLLRSLHEFS